MVLKVKRLTGTAKLPTKNEHGDMGYDIYADEDVDFSEGDIQNIKTGVAIGLPEGFGAFLVGRSGLTSKTMFRVNLGVIDNGYRGELSIMSDLYKGDKEDLPKFKTGDRIAQLVVLPLFDGEVVEVSDLDSTQRGDKGFGSSGL